jgi:DNA-binding SARP family transcriptional activator
MVLHEGGGAMSCLGLYLLGSPYLERDGAVVVLDRHKALALLAYLALAEGVKARDSLATLLWPDADQAHARGALRSTLAALRQVVGDDLLRCESDRMTLHRRDNLYVDVAHFYAVLAVADAHSHPHSERCDSCNAALTEATHLYRGDFMAGFSLHDAPEFDNWQTYRTETLRLELIGALERLAWLEAAREDYRAAIRHALRWLEQDPVCEAPHRALMLFYARSGNRSAALRQYQQCARILAEELDIEPEPETTALRDAVIRGSRGDLI